MWLKRRLWNALQLLQEKLRVYPTRGLRWWLVVGLLFMVSGLFLMQPDTFLEQSARQVQDLPSLTQEIRYRIPEAGEVFLVWGIDGWQVVPEESRPDGTVVKNKVMHTPMVQQGETFVAWIQVPAGTKIDYGFLVTKKSSGAAIHLWDGDYQTSPSPENSIDLETALVLLQDQAVLDAGDTSLVTQEIRYRIPEAGEVFLVWGIDGWQVVPEESRPDGTVVKNKVMHTPMAGEGDIFIATVQVPLGSTVDYGFLITKKRTGAGIEAVWDGRQEYQKVVTKDGTIEIEAGVDLTQAKELDNLLDVGLYLLIGVFIYLGISVLLIRLPRKQQVVTMALIGLTLLGLALRLWAASTANRLLVMPAHLIGDEPRYDNLAYALLQGEFFLTPAAPPIYPLFLAACYLVFGHIYAPVLYVQALIGAATIPLTYRLARRFTSQRGSLLAAALITLLPTLIGQVGNLHTEVLYTFLLLLTLLALLWALQVPRLNRFILAGVLLGISTLFRSVTALMPLLLPLILPRVWRLQHRIALWVVYGGAMAAVIVPWTYHNYRLHHAFVPFSLSLTMLWQGSPEFYHVMARKENAILYIWEEELNPARNGGHDPFTIEGERYFNARAVASIWAEPHVYAWYSLQKLAYFWIGHPAADWDWPFNFERLRSYYPAWQIAGLFGSRLLPFIALAGLIVLRRRLYVFAPLLIVCGYFMMIHAILNAEARYSTPLYPIVAIIIAAAMNEGLGLYYARTPSRHSVLTASNSSVFPLNGLDQRRFTIGLIYLRDLLHELVARDIKLRYKRSILGIAWSLLNPLAQLLIFIFLFRRVLPLNIPNYPLFVFSGVLAWSWFQSSLFLATGAITDNRELIRRPGFPAAILPVVTVTSNLIHFLLALPVLLLFVLLGGVQLTSASLVLPLIIVLQFILTLSLAYLIATFHVTFRDTQHLLGVLLLLFFYLTPVFYDASVVPARYQWLYQLNPMAHLIESYRSILMRGQLPEGLALLVLGLFAVGLLGLGYVVFTRASYRFVEEL